MSSGRSTSVGKRRSSAAEPTRRKDLLIAGGVGLAAVLVTGIIFIFLRQSPHKGTSDPPAKLRLEKVFEMYQAYINQKGKPPPNEDGFKEFVRSLPPEEKKLAGITDDVDAFLVSPRDGQKYVIRYGLRPDPGGATQAIAWEQAGKNGTRYVALSIGYVQQCDEETFNSYKK